MIRLLLETEHYLLTSNPLYTYQALAQHIQSDTHHGWNVWNAQCQVPSPQNPADQVLVQRQQRRRRRRKAKSVGATQGQLQMEVPLEFSQLPTYGLHCTRLGGYCCQVWKPYLPDIPVLMLQHPFGTTGGITSAAVSTQKQQQQQQHQHQQPASFTQNDSDMAAYWSTITAVPTADDSSARVVSKLETPNFFDILFQNNCLPTSDDCHKCLKRYTSTTGCDDQCRHECPCYCKVLCQIRPPPKHVQAVWYVSPPLYQLQTPLAPRLIPRIVHQTW
jgi:hypothetical protein